MQFLEHISDEDVNQLPLISFGGEVIVVDTEDQLEAEEYLSKQKVIGFDTESRASFTKGIKNSISLVQLGAEEKTFLFRVNKVPLSPGIIKVIQSRKITKVGLAINDDIKRMGEVNNFHPHGFVDLQSIVRDWGVAELSLKKITAIVLEGRISKAQRLSNWNATKLTDAQKIYAATDAWSCMAIYNKLQRTPKKNVRTESNPKKR